MNAYLEKEVKLSILEHRTKILKEKIDGMSEHLIVLPQKNFTNAEFKEFILGVEAGLKKNFETKRMQMLSKNNYVLKITEKEKEVTINEETVK